MCPIRGFNDFLFRPILDAVIRVLSPGPCLNKGLHLMDENLKVSYQEVRTYRFKVETTQKDIARLQGKAASRNIRDQELALEHAKAFCRAEKRGKREVAAVVNNRSAQFVTKFRELKKVQKFVGDYRECQGSVGDMWRTQATDYAFQTDMDKMSGFLKSYPNAVSMFPPIEEKIRELWAPMSRQIQRKSELIPWGRMAR
ncbi:hypothetical protein Bca4012_020366 [Brassica carinata]